MKAKLKTELFLSLALCFGFLPQMSYAAGFSQSYDSLLNPIPSKDLYCATSVCDLTSFILLIARDILQIIPVLAVLMIIVAGFKMVIAAGNEEKLLEAKRTLLWAVLGLVIALMSVSIVAIVRNLIGAG